MRLKKILSSIAALAVASSAFSGLTITASADEAKTTTITPQMTYVDADGADTAVGYVDTARSGYHSISNGNTIAFGRASWGENKTAYLKIDASGITDSTIAAATLKMQVSGSSDSKRTTTYGAVNVEYTGWNESLTHNIAVANGMLSGTLVGNTCTTSTKSSTEFEEKTIDITDAIKTDSDRIVTIAIYETAAAGGYIKTPLVEIVSSNSNVYTVTYVVEGVETSEQVIDGATVLESGIPKTDKTAYIFKGWAVNDDISNIISTETLKTYEIKADTKLTAVYEKDAEYIEPMTDVKFDTFPSGGLLVAGADENTDASNPITVKVSGELGTDLLENPDSRVDAPVVTYELKGFRWVASKNEASTDPADSNTYCDSYAALEVKDNAADFKLKSHPFNYYGEVVATVTYNGVTKTISRPLAYIGNPVKASANDILPRGGYISDFNLYSPDMVGYEAAISPNNTGATDVVTDNWAAYGGNTKKLTIAAENGNKFLKLNALGTNSSCFAVNQIEDVTDSQLVFDQMVRFNNAGTAILLKTDNPVTWKDHSTSVTITFNGTGFAINNGETFAEATTGVWYRVVISSDVTSKKYFAKVYSADNKLIGESEIADFVNAGSTNPTYYMYRLPDRAMGELAFNNVKIYRATINQASMATTATSTTLAIPEDGAAATTAELTVSAKTTEGYEAIGAATWTVADDAEGITVTPSANDTHAATVSVSSAASAGTAAINVTVGGITKTIDLTITSSQDSIKFATPIINSISIPMDDKAETVTYAATVIDKDGKDIADKDVTFALYDKNNTNPAVVEGVTFENGVLTVSKEAKPCVVTVRATSTNSNNEEITNAIRVTIHGLAFDLGAGTEEDVVSGYTAITPTTTYSDKAGYGIEGSATVSGTASLEDADTDALDGTFTFKAKVTNDKIYKVTINYSGTASFENISTDLSGVVRANETKGAVEYLTFVHDGVLDINLANASVSSIIIEKVEDKTPGMKPNIFTIGDSTIANRGSWAYNLSRDFGNYPELGALATFSNNGRGGKNLSSYYTGGELWDRVVTNIRPGDYVMIGDMGTNGMGVDFEGSFTYYIDACLAMGAKVILNSYSPHLAVGNYANCYDSATQKFTGYRQDSYDNIVRNIYETRKTEFVGFVDIGKNSDTAFNAYVDDYAANGFDSRDAAAQAIIACAGSPGASPDHNHYGNGEIAAKLMVEGYNGTAGIVSELVRLLSAEDPNPPTPATKYTVTFVADDATVSTVKVEEGKTVAEIPAVPAKDGYTGKWTVDGADFTASTVITADTTVTAVYTSAPIPTAFIVTFVTENAKVLVDGEEADSKTVNEGSTVTFAVDPADGYKVVAVKIGDEEIAADDDGMYTTPAIGSNVTVTVTTEAVEMPPIDKEVKVTEKSLSDGKAETTVINTTDEAVTVAVLVAVYDADDKLVSVKMGTKTIEANGEETVTAENTDDGATVKAFVWNAATQANLTEVLTAL